jgi:hypothetical protein
MGQRLVLGRRQAVRMVALLDLDNATLFLLCKTAQEMILARMVERLKTANA